MGVKNWIQRQLGIADASRIERLESLESWTIRDVANRLKDSFIILAGDRQILRGTEIHFPDDKKYGILCLGNETMIMNNIIRGSEQTARDET